MSDPVFCFFGVAWPDVYSVLRRADVNIDDFLWSAVVLVHLAFSGAGILALWWVISVYLLYFIGLLMPGWAGIYFPLDCCGIGALHLFRCGLIYTTHFFA